MREKVHINDNDVRVCVSKVMSTSRPDGGVISIRGDGINIDITMTLEDLARAITGEYAKATVTGAVVKKVI